MAEIAANAIGANGRLVRVGAYYHDLGKSLQPKYFIENLEPGETSPARQAPARGVAATRSSPTSPRASSARARRGCTSGSSTSCTCTTATGCSSTSGRKCQEQGNPKGLTIEAVPLSRRAAAEPRDRDPRDLRRGRGRVAHAQEARPRGDRLAGAAHRLRQAPPRPARRVGPVDVRPAPDQRTRCARRSGTRTTAGSSTRGSARSSNSPRRARARRRVRP